MNVIWKGRWSLDMQKWSFYDELGVLLILIVWDGLITIQNLFNAYPIFYRREGIKDLVVHYAIVLWHISNINKGSNAKWFVIRAVTHEMCKNLINCDTPMPC
jgi:hypothetical protein